MAARHTRRVTTQERQRREQQRQDALAALHDRLIERVRALRTGEDWRRWLEIASRLRTYSFRNSLLILAQKGDATAVAGYQAWRRIGRQVAKGEKGIQILAPIVRRHAEVENIPDDEASSKQAPRQGAEHEDTTVGKQEERRLVGFRVTHVWDISQTTGDPVREPPRPALLHGQAPDGLWDALAAQATARNFTVERGDCHGANGYTDFRKRTIRVRDDVSDLQALKTLLHEIGHTLMHDPADFNGTTHGCRGTQEVEAESVAYLVAAAHGLPTDDYTFPYVTSWAVDVDSARPEDVVEQTGERVMRTAARVLEFLEPLALHTERAVTADANQHNAASMRLHADAPPPLIATPLSSDPDRLIAAHREAVRFYREHLLSTAGGGPRAYLTNRGLGHVLTQDSSWQVGYACGEDTRLTDHLRAVGFTDTEIASAGLALNANDGILIDRFRNRIMLPVHDEAGRPVAFIGLARPDAGPGVPQYLSSPDTPIYRQSAVLYGLAEQRDLFLAGLRPVIVQHPLDVLAVAATHTPAAARPVPAVAPVGNQLTSEHASLLARYGSGTSNGIVIAISGDCAGRAAVIHASGLLDAWRDNADVLQLRAGESPANVLHTDGVDALRKILADPQRTVPLAEVRLDEPLTAQHERIALLDDRKTAVTPSPRSSSARQHRLADALWDTLQDHISDSWSLPQSPTRSTREVPG
jgi:DNA primase